MVVSLTQSQGRTYVDDWDSTEGSLLWLHFEQMSCDRTAQNS